METDAAILIAVGTVETAKDRLEAGAIGAVVATVAESHIEEYSAVAEINDKSMTHAMIESRR